MQEDLHQNYFRVSERINAQFGNGSSEVAAVGEAWGKLNWSRRLYDGPDEYHPSPAGSLLAAMTIYSAIYRETISFVPPANMQPLLAHDGLNASDWSELVSISNISFISTPEPCLLLYLPPWMLLLGSRPRRAAQGRWKTTGHRPPKAEPDR
jgi:hypothetical protein